MNKTTISLFHLGIVAGMFDELGIAELIKDAYNNRPGRVKGRPYGHPQFIKRPLFYCRRFCVFSLSFDQAQVFKGDSRTVVINLSDQKID